MAVEINHNVKTTVDIPQLSTFGDVITKLESQLSNFSNMFGASARTGKTSPDMPVGKTNIDTSIKAPFDNLSNKIQQLTNALNKNSSINARTQLTPEERLRVKRESNLIDQKNREVKAQEREALAAKKSQDALNLLKQKSQLNLGARLDRFQADDAQRQKIRQERAQDRDENAEMRQAQKRRNWQYSLMVGAGLFAVNRIGEAGRVYGSEAQSINQGMTNYNDFLTNYYNRKADFTQSTISSGSMLAATAVAAMTKNPLYAVGAFAASAGLNYFTGKKTEEDKAGTEFSRNQEIAGWRLRMSGLYGKSTNAGLDTGYGISRLGSGQAMSLSDPYAPYAQSYGNVILNARRDKMFGMSDVQKNEYNSELVRTSLAIGAPDLNALNNTVGTLSAMTGKDSTVIMAQMHEDNEKYGGDTAANTAKLVDILQNTPLSEGTARQLVNQYQYNTPMLNNQLALATASPAATAAQRVLMQIGGASPAELQAGEFTEAHKQEVAKNVQDIRRNGIGAFNPRMQIRSMAVVPGQSFYANHAADIMGTNAPTVPLTDNLGMKAMGQSIKDMLGNLTVNTQTVNATNVTINGTPSNASTTKSSTSAPISSTPINTGTGSTSPNNAIKSSLFVVRHIPRKV